MSTTRVSTTKASSRLGGRRSALALVLLLVLASPLLRAQEELQRGLADLLIDGEKAGSLEFSLGGGGQLLLAAADLKPLLSKLLKPRISAALFSDNRLLSLSELRLYGIRVSLDQSSLLLRIDLDPEALEPSLVAARESARRGRGEERVGPAGFSLTLGAGAEFDPSWTYEGPLLRSTWSSKLRLSPALAFLGLVAESDLSLTAGPLGSSVSLDEGRILRDFPRLGARLQAGIVTAAPSSFQAGRELYGLAFGREPILPGGDASPELAAGSIELHEPATLRIYVNGSFARQLSLPAGSYRLSDLPLASGLNEVRVHIEERGQAPRELSLGIPFDQGLLGAGKLDYALALGASREDPGRPFGLGHLGLGLADRAQLGADLEAGYSRALAGLSGLAATPLGSLGLAGALSLDFGGTWPPPPSYALRASWRFASFAMPGLPRLGAAAEFREAGFFVPGATKGTTEPTWSLSAQAGLPLPGRIGILSLSGDASYLSGLLASWSFTAGPTFSASRSAILSLSGGSDWKRGEYGQPRLSLSLTVAPPDRRSLSYQRDLLAGQDNVGLGFPLGEVGGLNLNLRNPAAGSGDQELDLLGSANLSRASLGASAAFGSDPESGLRGGQLSFSAGTALALAEGVLGFTRSPGAALALVRPGPELRSAALELRPASGAPLRGRGDRVLALPDLKPYSPYVANIELPDSPPESRPSPASVEFLPTYRSVSVLRLGLAASETIRALLVDERGRPKPLLGGSLVGTEGEAGTQGATFTDEEGIFECYGLRPGKLAIRWDDGSTSELLVPAGEAGSLHELGTVVAAAAATKEQP